MPIKIKYPSTAKDPVVLPRRFLAFGTKKPGELPAGVLVSVNNNHQPDGKVVVAGSPLGYKKKGGVDDEPERWALQFRVLGRIPGPDQWYSLLVFDALTLPATGTATKPITFERIDGLRLRRHGRRKDAKKGPFRFGDPASGDHMPADQFVSYGDLPSGNYDVDLTKTVLYQDGTTTPAAAPQWSWTDGDGFYAVFFDTVPRPTEPTKVDVHLVFLPSGDDDDTPGVFVDPPAP